MDEEYVYENCAGGGLRDGSFCKCQEGHRLVNLICVKRIQNCTEEVYYMYNNYCKKCDEGFYRDSSLKKCVHNRPACHEQFDEQYCITCKNKLLGESSKCDVDLHNQTPGCLYYDRLSCVKCEKGFLFIPISQC